MSKIKHNSISGLAGKLCVLALLGLSLTGYLLLSSASRAQSPQASTPPTVSSDANAVAKEGYALKPAGVATDRWPAVRVDFSIERGDQTLFRELSNEDVEASLNGGLLPLSQNSLKQNNAPIKVFFMLDRSGSMVDSKQGINKLLAAKESLRDFISRLEPNDVAAVGAFDSLHETVISPASNKSSLSFGLNNDRLNPRSDKYTYLYDAVDFAIREADKNGIKDIVLLSDGWEDTKESRAMTESAFESFKHQREDAISRLARQKGIRIFTIAIGAQGDKETLGYAYVDYESMCSISNGTQGGTCRHIDLPELKRLAGNDSTRFNSLIASEMKQTLAEMKKNFRYSYSLSVDFPRDIKHEDGELALNFTVDNGRVKLPVVFPYTWDAKTDTPVFRTWKTLAPIFIETAVISLDWGSLAQIYLLTLLPLGLLSLVPAAYNRLMVMREVQQMKKAIVEVGPRSELLGQQCPNESGEWGKRFAFKVGDAVVVCPNPTCRTAHHLSCWEFNQHQCMIHVCEYPMKVPSRVLAKYGVTEASRGVNA